MRCCDLHDQMAPGAVPWMHKLYFGSKLPAYVEREVYRLIIRSGQRIIKHGRGPGSLANEEDAGLDYTVVLGSAIKEDLPWLWMLYTGALAEWVCHSVDQAMVPSPDVDSAININVLCGPSPGYEPHVDAQGWTALLYLEVPPTYEGGELVVTPPRQDNGIQPVDWWLTPEPGQVVLIHGSKVPHRVRPLTGTGIRISIPMVFLTPEEAAQPRPDGLDKYLYGESHE